jgi:predicted DNA-binding WGR domain protein
MSRYALSEGGSDKFWEVAVDGATLTVRFGRIGSAGQTRSKVFADATAAEREKAKLVKEKTGKGYAPAGEAAAMPKLAAAAPAAIAPAAPEPAAEPPALPLAADAPPGTLFAAEPLPTRTRPGEARAADWASLRETFPDRIGEDHRLLQAPTGFGHYAEKLKTLPARVNPSLAWLAERFRADGPEVATLDDATRYFMHLHAIQDADPGIFFMAEFTLVPGFADKIRTFTQCLIAARGAPLAVEAAMAAEAQREHAFQRFWWTDPVAHALRLALPGAPAAEYDAVLAWCLAEQAARPDWQRDSWCAFILGDDREAAHDLQPLAVLEAAARQGVDVGQRPELRALIVEAPPAAVAAWRIRNGYDLYFSGCCVGTETAAQTMIMAARAHADSALPVLSWLLHYSAADQRTTVAKAMLETREGGALTALLPLLHEPLIRAAVDQATEAYPASTARQFLTVLAGGRVEPAIRARLLDLLRCHGPKALRRWAEGLGARATQFLDGLIAAGTAPAAPREAWPELLQAPPWRQKRKASEEILLAIAPIPTPFAGPEAPGPDSQTRSWRLRDAVILPDLAALPGFIAEAEAAPPRSDWNRLPEAVKALPSPGAPPEDALAWLERRLQGLNPWIVRASRYGRLYDALEQQPPPLALMLWELTPIQIGLGLRWQETENHMLARFGAAALPGLLKVIEQDPVIGFRHAAEVDAAAIAPLAARALHRLKKARDPAIAWLRRHPQTAMMRLVPEAVGKPGEARDAAEATLRFLLRDGAEAAAMLEQAVAAYAVAEPRMTEAVRQALARDPSTRLPAKLTKLPAWFAPAALSRPQLRAGGALPEEALVAVAEMLSFSPADTVYAGIPALRDACEPRSLGVFAWDLFSAWMAAGAPAKESWAMRALGWLGDDDCARQLTRLIRKWPGEAAHARAVLGLEVLTDLGSDVALMNLNGIAEKLKFKGLQEKARERIAALAEARGLSPEELADRLAPDLDLDEQGGLDLDFGPRRFRVGFDEFLKPWVRDAAGGRLKDLPKPNKGDDAELAAAAVARWAAIRKDARAVASLQLSRLEAMLATARRVQPAVFREVFAGHPLIRHLAQRLVWGVFDGTAAGLRPRLAFRVTEALELTDAADAPVAVDQAEGAAGLVGLLHPLHMTADEIAAWGTLFGEYEIAQPFPQLGRERFALTEAEKASSEIARFEGREVEAARLRGMGAEGWPPGAPQDGGVIGWLERRVTLAGGKPALALLYFGDGLFTGAPDAEDKVQHLGKIELRQTWGARETEQPLFGALDPVTASELLRAATRLVEAARR